MKVFACSACRQSIFFENNLCTSCGRQLAYLPDVDVMSPIELAEPPAAGENASVAEFVALAPQAKNARYRRCRNDIEHGACNWAVPASEAAAYCRACRLNAMIPNLASAHAKDAWVRIEKAKRRLLYSLLALGLKVETRSEQPDRGLGFEFKEDAPGAKVMTGHADGVITLNLAEADAPFREELREKMGEAYRTLLGHFRHEIGHYYWDRLIAGSSRIDAFRAEFGDERASYDEALKRHYSAGAPSDWPLRFVSAYASMHPWEDWAESWAHYLHIVDTLDTARSYGLALQPEVVGRPSSPPELRVTARNLHFHDFEDLIRGWVPLTVALNSLNRSMGHADVYPFVLSERAIQKLRFVHDVIDSADDG